MDDLFTDLRIILTVLSFICFIAIALWAWSKSAKHSFEQAALLPFLEDGHDTRGQHHE